MKKDLIAAQKVYFFQNLLIIYLTRQKVHQLINVTIDLIHKSSSYVLKDMRSFQKSFV